MEPDAEDPDISDNMVPWSGSDGSQELYVSESYDEDDASEEEHPVDPQPAHVKSNTECGEHWESESEQQSLPELSGSEEDVSYREDDDIYLSESRDISESLTSLSTHQEHPDPEYLTTQMSLPHSPSSSSSSSLGCTAEMTQALTLTTDEPLGASNRQSPGTGNRRVESSEEGGSSEAPPASVFFGISDEGAEQAEKWNSESDTDLCRPDRHRARYTRHSESLSERHVKETKSKCKRIALLLTDAPNPQNKGALLFKKRRQRVKKYTLVSYGTGENQLDNKDQIEEEAEEVTSAAYNLIATSDSEVEEEYSVYHQQHHLRLNWESLQEMEAETKGKGVLMFAQRRKRMDEIVSEHEELRSKGLPVEASAEPEHAAVQNTYETKETYLYTDQANYLDSDVKQHVDYQENIQQMNLLSNVPKPLVPNRTAKPFGVQVSATVPAVPAGVAPVSKKPETRFKVPVPINTSPHVWSPTGDIIASRDERISVPAIKTGILPESKRKGSNKQTLEQEAELQFLQNKGDRRSYIESEEDCFSLGAEACNFMQPRAVKLKNPPPVAPKPTTCPTWMRRSPSAEPYIPPRSPVSQPSHSPAGPHSQHYLQPHDWVQPQQMANRWAQDQTQATLQTPTNAWAPVSSPSHLHLQPTTNNWSLQQPQSPVSMQARSPTYSPHHSPSPLVNKPESAPHSVASCPPQGKAYIHASKPTQAKGGSKAGEGQLAGKGAALFAKRQSRMEKYVVDSETVHANRARSPSPTSSLPNSWRYSSNVRAPPPLSYNPLLAPFYPPSAAKQPPSTSPKIKPKTKQKPKTPPKHLDSLDIMKHQPYQLDSSLFKYEEYTETKSPSPKPPSKFEITKNLKQKSAASHSYSNVSELDSQRKSEAPAKSSGSVSSPISSAHQNARSAEPVVNDKHLDVKLTVTPAAHHTKSKQAPIARPTSASSQHSSTADSIAAAFSPASIIARGARQMAPRPKFSAKKPVMTGKQWKPVAMTH
ncbi:synaptopodin-2 [Sphaeramia orbicularis]|uniref:synaptopodin-2 n=1 Tax=Sphaeramia orbicularis TaxID=375764 RepID=UPI0011810475|nr:synaptopodin-2-like [Sphaeramia orbicularis]